jgi:predicted Zn finger-like uncharacterized protein
MALATRCPHCHTTFRVAHDQLKLRAGLVRCGACKEIFNGIEHLLRPEQASQDPVAVTPPMPRASAPPENLPSTIVREAAPAADAEPATPPDAARPSLVASDKPAPTSKSTASSDLIDFSEFLEPAKTAKPSSVPLPDQADQAAPAPTDPQPDDPLQRMTLMDFTDPDDHPGQGLDGGAASDENAAEAEPERKEDADAPDPIAQAIDELQRKPLRRPRNALKLENVKKPDKAESEVPTFVKHGRRKRQIGRTVRVLMGIGSVVLFFGLIAQATYAFRNQIAVRLPQAKPVLAKICSVFDCQVDLPAQIDAVSIESSELQTLPAVKDTFVLTTLLRNHSATAQAWPNIELTLNDTNEKAVARRVFTPREYMTSPQDLARGFAPKSEQSVRLFFELSQLKPMGYRVYLFYP